MVSSFAVEPERVMVMVPFDLLAVTARVGELSWMVMVAMDFLELEWT